ncbi:MAG TPA: lysylphosphatidylglycerol synthase transmembrane domain-containing protein [Gemmatimonadaceae bacterium]|nr:lysylphosphatidylglycerol synthase transmembrane domain-containing protein [Gemmatimonadaceae bacterium]
MTWKRWFFTALSFAAVIGASVYFIARWWGEGTSINLPLTAHLLAIGALVIEIVSRAWKISWSAKALRLRLSFMTSLRTCLAGDFGASVTPARSGAEPARFLVLAEAGIPASDALVVLYAELFLEMLSLATVVAVVAVIFRGAGLVLGALVGVVGIYSAFVLGIAALAVLLSRKPPHSAPPAWARMLLLNERRWHVVERWLAQVRTTVGAMRNLDMKWAVASYLASVVHVSIRLAVLPAIVYGAGGTAPLAPLALWPLGFLYGAAVVPAPGGGGAVELAFSAALKDVIGTRLFAPALLWWRFYTFYIYILLGALAAGRTAIRALKKRDELEEELERGED